MKKIRALTGFDHHGLRKAGEVFEATNQTADELIKAELVEEVVSEDEASESTQAQTQTKKSKSK